MVNIIASDYQVLRDGTLQLDDRETQQYTFQVQTGFHYSGALRNQAILSFNIRPANAGRLTVRAIGSGATTFVNRRFFSQSHTRMHQETFDLDGIISATNQSVGEPIGSLPIEFRAEDGPLILSDIVIHYKIIIPVS